jgi:alkaline phosphatase D
MLNTTRRTLLGAIPALAAATPARAASALARGRFTHSVASGDPMARSVILWTRFEPSTPGEATIGWEISEDERFARVQARGQATASVFDNWCVKVEAGGLLPGRRYYYRFLGADGPSPTGLTCTAPEGSAASLTFAVFSCSNLPFGYFHAYAHAAARADIDLCIHTGDYIYEYGPGTYPSAADALPGRTLAPDHEIVTLPDYHARYATYRADPALQEVHRVKPFMTVWDDHELTNDAWKDGAQNHQPATEGDWSVRRALAAKAYADWMPMRRQSSLLQIYRRLDWGNLATFLMLDTRLIGRDKQLDWREALAGADSEAAAVRAMNTLGRGPLADPKRTLLGAEQEAWMRTELRRSKARGARWQVLAQQLVTGAQLASPAIAGMLADDASAGMKQRVMTSVALASQGYGANLDSWAGYPAARERFLAACATDGANCLVLSGDSHNAWANNLKAEGGRNAAVELAGMSVTSPGFESILTKGDGAQRRAAMLAANPDMAWCDIGSRGYAAATLTREKVEVDWVAFDSVRSADAPAPTITKSTAEASRANGVGKWAF